MTRKVSVDTRGAKCPDCKSRYITGDGRVWVVTGKDKRSYVQRFQCQDCGRRFVDPLVKRWEGRYKRRKLR